MSVGVDVTEYWRSSITALKVADGFRCIRRDMVTSRMAFWSLSRITTSFWYFSGSEDWMFERPIMSNCKQSDMVSNGLAWLKGTEVGSSHSRKRALVFSFVWNRTWASDTMVLRSRYFAFKFWKKVKLPCVVDKHYLKGLTSVFISICIRLFTTFNK